ncbi:MAG: O-antigen ligase family protein [Candidatus Magasanikbacteria bacterium]|nr:O-antigen ligase family protein [Candidatus Magasanikbacteria bacterium]
MSKKFELAVKVIIGATFFVPLILLPENYIFPFIVPKIVWFRSLAMLMLGGYILLLASNWQEYRVRFTPINVAVGLFFVSFAISTFVGVDWYKSLWDNHERMLGLFTLFHYVVYYFVITSIIKEWRDWKWLLRVFLLAGMIVMIIGGMQKINPEFLINRGSGRVSATLGNAIYFSGYGLFLFFIGLLLALKEGEEIFRLRSLHSGGQARQVFWFWYAVIGAIFGFLGIFWGGTKGTLLGLLVAGLVLLVGYLITVRGAKKVRLILTILLVLGVSILGSLFAFRKNEAVTKVPVLGALLNLSLTSGTGETRVMAWQIAIEAWGEKPILGWGPNNYYYAFNKYYQSEFLGHGWGETWFDNAHSAVFNTLAVQGVVGLLLYVALFFVSVHSLWYCWKKGEADKHVFIIGSAFLAGHFVHNAVVFENPTSYLYFFFFLAFINSQTSRKLITGSHKEKGKSISIGLYLAVGIVILLTIYSTNVNPALANMASLNTLQSLNTGQMPVEAYKKAAGIFSPHIDDIRSDFVRGVLQVIPQYVNAGLVDKAKELYKLAYDESEKNLALHPLDIRTHLQLSQLIQEGVMNLKEPTQSLAEAEAVLKDAMTKSPKRQQIIYQLSMLESLMGKPDEAVALLQTAIADDDKISESWWRLALVYAQSGNNEKARETIQMAQDRGMQFDSQGQSAISLILQQANGGSK